MGVMPVSKVDKIEFCEDHVAPFTTNTVAIGTTAPAVADFTAKTTAARAAFETKRAAENAAKDATTNFDIAMLAMTTAVADIIKQVRAKAATAGDGVYALASLPVPATPAPKPAPGKPTGMVVELDESGNLNLKWECPNPPGTSGTIYQIWRRVDPTGPFTYIGGVGAKKFTDATMVAGSSQVTYQMQAVRSTTTGPWAQFNVNFGKTSGGVMTASVTESAPVKIAA